MKKLAVVLAVVVSGFVNAQDSLKYTFIYNQFAQQFLKDVNYNSYCSPAIRNAFETNIMDSLVELYEFTPSDLKRFKTQFNNYKIAAGVDYKKIKSDGVLMTYGEWLDIKGNYNPVFNLCRNPNVYIVNTISVKSNKPEYKAIELVEKCWVDYNNKNIMIFNTTIYTQDVNGFWDAIEITYNTNVLECAHCTAF